jgi:CRISPR system Cascade subunit CasD
MPEEATLVLRLDGPLQAWGTGSKWRIRHTNTEPSFSGVVGLLCAALGWTRDHPLKAFHGLRMAVRADREGQVIHDYHTVGAAGRPPVAERFQGSMTAGGKIKITATTGEIETLVSERYYLADAVFTVALSGPRDFLEECRAALLDPKFPLYLGRKSCPPSVPPLRPCDTLQEGTDPAEVLRGMPWRSRMKRQDKMPSQWRMVVPAQPGEDFAQRRADIPLSFLERRFAVRYVKTEYVSAQEVSTEDAHFAAPGKVNRYHKANSPAWERKRQERLTLDGHLCVFTGLPAEHVHHVTYERANEENVQTDLRCLSQLAHDAVTMLEAESGMRRDRIDPFPPDRDTPEYRQLCDRINAKMGEIVANHDLSAREHFERKQKRRKEVPRHV